MDAMPAPTKTASPAVPVAQETFFIPALDPGIDLFVARKYPAGKKRFAASRIILFVHGSTQPGSAFDVALPCGPGPDAPDLSWMDFMARKGFCVYAHDLRGYGRSTRPATMGELPENNPPIVRTPEAVRDVKAVADWIRRHHGVKTINVVGWSWGCVQSAQYTAENPGVVGRLVLFAPLFLLEKPRPDTNLHYRAITREDATADRLRGIPEGRDTDISPDHWFEKVWQASLATDPEGAQRTPPAFRAPLGTAKDAHEYWSRGKRTYDPAKITAPTFIITGEWDQATPVPTSLKLFSELTAAPYRRLEILPEATHAALHEKNRYLLFHAVLRFLTEKPPA